MSAAVKYLIRKVARAQAESDTAYEAQREASTHADECRQRVWDSQGELQEALEADIEKAKADL